MNAAKQKTTAEKTMEIMEQTRNDPEKRERLLRELTDSGRPLCPGVICKCFDDESKFCPMHGEKR